MNLPPSGTLTPSPRVIALDVGGTSVKSALVAQGGYVIGEPAITPINSSGEAESILSTFAQIIRTHLRESHSSHLIGVALGFPGPFDYTAGICLIEGVEKYGAIYGVNMRAALRARLDLGDLPILFRNDAEAAVVGEARYGAGRDYRRLIGVTLGTGCGSAFMIDGVPVTSGQGVYQDEVMFALVAYGELYLKVDAGTVEAFRAAGSSPFSYESRGRRTQMSYWRLPHAALDDPDEAARWGRLALETARRSGRGKIASRRTGSWRPA